MKLSEIREWAVQCRIRRWATFNDVLTLKNLWRSCRTADAFKFAGVVSNILRIDVSVCPHCEAPFFEQTGYSTEEYENVVCDSCIDCDFRWSDRCEVYVLCENWDPSIHEYYDDDDDDDDDDSEVRGYGANALDYLKFRALPTEKTNDRTLFLGIELEVERRRRCPEDITNITLDQLGRDYVILKEDGSLSNGFEIVTAPSTLDFHLHAWDKFFEPNTGAWKHLKGFTTNTAGMHVHMSRAAFTPLVLSKMLVFYNSANNRNFIERIAGRGMESLSRWAKLKPNIDLKVCKNPDYDRYSACNLSTKDEKTVEIRIFRSNVSRLGFFKNLEFVAAAYYFADSASMKDLGYKDFLKWLQRPHNLCHFTNLATWLAQNGIINLNRPILTARSKRLTMEEAA